MRKILSLTAVALMALQGLAPAAEAKVTRRRLADGVVLRTIKQRNPRLHIRIVRIGPAARVNLRTVLAQGRLPGHEATSSMARRRRAIVAVNGDYADPSGRPVMTFAQGGRLAQTPLSWGRNFAIARDRRTSYIGHPKVRVELLPEGVEKAIRIARLNNGPPTYDQLTVHTSAGGTLERPPARNSCQARLEPASGPRIAGFGLEIGFTVGKMRCGPGSMNPRDGAVVSARRNTAVTPHVKGLVPGTSATLRWSLGWDQVHETVGGNPTLVEDGRIVVGRSTHPFFARHPRTGVGITGNNSVLLITVDGRWRKSRGMKLRQFARFFKDEGATWALNLDGGGSTTMVVKGTVVNRTSDGSERPVSSALAVVPARSTSARAAAMDADSPSEVDAATAVDAATEVDDMAVPAARLWEQAVTDPASTGGMAAAALARRAAVTPALRRAAERFHASRNPPGRER